MEIAGTPIALGHSQRAAVGRKWKLTTENAETAAMYDAIIPPRWAYHQKFLSVGGWVNSQMSRAANATPITPKVIATMLNRAQTGPGRTMPSTISATLPTNARAAATQSMAPGPSPSNGRFRDSTRYPRNAK